MKKPRNDGLESLYRKMQRPSADRNFKHLQEHPPKVKSEVVLRKKERK